MSEDIRKKVEALLLRAKSKDRATQELTRILGSENFSLRLQSQTPRGFANSAIIMMAGGPVEVSVPCPR